MTYVDDLARGIPSLSINNRLSGDISLSATEAWIEGCRVQSSLSLSDRTMVVGVDVEQALELPPHACSDVFPGTDRCGSPIHFVRCYYDDDPVQYAPASELRLCGELLLWWMDLSGVIEGNIWDAPVPVTDRGIWNARLFPAVRRHQDNRQWLWMLRPKEAAAEQLREWAAADRYSFLRDGRAG